MVDIVKYRNWNKSTDDYVLKYFHLLTVSIAYKI